MNTVVHKVKNQLGQGINDECITQFTIEDNLNIESESIDLSYVQVFFPASPTALVLRVLCPMLSASLACETYKW